MLHFKPTEIQNNTIALISKHCGKSYGNIVHQSIKNSYLQGMIDGINLNKAALQSARQLCEYYIKINYN
jgi:hypothetical protein